MPKTYLSVSYKEKDLAKSLGAQWDPKQRQWFVPDGYELEPFAQWLPYGENMAIYKKNNNVIDNNVANIKGISLSALLTGVSQSVAQIYSNGVWVLVEVVELHISSGHVFIDVSERNSNGSILARTRSVIWSSTANTLLPQFERITGVHLAPGLKLLVHARPVFNPQYGFTLEIDAVDSEYTLGDLEARKREIRDRLQAEGIFSANRMLTVPWDFQTVLVVAPAGAAGLGDFQVEANRLENRGICKFIYLYSRFQGEGAAQEITDVLKSALAVWPTDKALPDALVVIRGGGAVNDLAWLNDYNLARFICTAPVPVLCGIGHERDSTILDEVACMTFDTPSKVILGIQLIITKRITEAKNHFDQITQKALKILQLVKSQVALEETTVRNEAIRHLNQGKQTVKNLIQDIRFNAIQEIRWATEQTLGMINIVKSQSLNQVLQAKQDVPLLWNTISLEAQHQLQSIREALDIRLADVFAQSQYHLDRAKIGTESSITQVSTSARILIREGRVQSESLMREISGQGPDKTLKRGFALVRDQTGEVITRAVKIPYGTIIEIQFSDGQIVAITTENKIERR